MDVLSASSLSNQLLSSKQSQTDLQDEKHRLQEVSTLAELEPNQAVSEGEPTLSGDRLHMQLDQLNEQFEQLNRSLRFEMDEQTGQSIVLIKNTQTDEVIRQIPSQAVLKIAQDISQFLESMQGAQPLDVMHSNSTPLGLFANAKA